MLAREKKLCGSSVSSAFYFCSFDFLLDSAIESAITSEGLDSSSSESDESLSLKIPGVNPALTFIRFVGI